MGASCTHDRHSRDGGCLPGCLPDCQREVVPEADCTPKLIANAGHKYRCPSHLLLGSSVDPAHTHASVTHCMMLQMIEIDKDSCGKLDREETIRLFEGLIPMLANPAASPTLVAADLEMVCRRFVPGARGQADLGYLEQCACQAYTEWTAARLLRAQFLANLCTKGSLQNTAEAQHQVLSASGDSLPLCLWVVGMMFPHTIAVKEFGPCLAGELQRQVLQFLDTGTTTKGFEFPQLLSYCQQEAAMIPSHKVVFAEAHTKLTEMLTGHYEHRTELEPKMQPANAISDVIRSM